MWLSIKVLIIIAITFGLLSFLNLVPFFHHDLIFFTAAITFSLCSMMLMLQVTVILPLLKKLQSGSKSDLSTHTDSENYAITLQERADQLEAQNAQLEANITLLKKLLPVPEQPRPLANLAHYDELTALPNRIFFNEILNKTINHAKRHNRVCSILLVDIKNFKAINEQFNWTLGDFVLKELSARLLKTLRADDILARLESDEFIVLLNDIGKPKFASTVAEKIIAKTTEPIISETTKIKLLINIGIAIFPNDGNSLETLLRNADTALVKAKSFPTNGYQFYSEEIDLEARRFKQLDNALKETIEKNQLCLHYQPKMHIKRGRIIGVEALIRWSHPEFGNIDPNTFIPLAEETGFTMEIARWAIFEACRINKHWQVEGYNHINISINLSAKQFYHPELTKIITAALEASQLNPTYLELEINESTIMDNISEASKILEEIKSIGIKIAIDHFGTGYTSIYYLKKFPISTIKIDSSFIKGVPINPNDIAVTNAVISLAHTLGLEVIAEGVETAEQVKFLSEQNCDIVQGYYLSHPLPAQKIERQFIKLSDAAPI